MANKHTIISRPVARTERLLVEAVGDETVIYDQETHVAHALKPLAAAVYMYANGENTAAEIADLASYRLETTVTESEVADAIAQLSSLELLDTQELDKSGLSRRDALKVFGAVGAGTVLVSSVAAPFASAAGLANDGANYLCGTGDHPLTGTYKGNPISWPQVWTSSGLAGPFTPGGPTTSPGTYDLGSACYVTAPTCSYTYTDDETPPHTYHVTADCETVPAPANASTSTVCALGKNAQINGNTVGTGSSAGAIVTGVESSECRTGQGICVTQVDSKTYAAVPGTFGNHSCDSGQILVKLSSTDVIVTSNMVTTTGGQTGTYECVPCDGNVTGSSYQCCEAVCVPNTINGQAVNVTGAVTNPSDQITSSGGYSPYTKSAFAIWGSGIGSQYPNKWCTTNPCNSKGDCS